MNDYKRLHPCVDCGESDIRCLDFDHRDRSQKTNTISMLVLKRWSLARIQAEIDKCDVRCANCHRKKTAANEDWLGHQLPAQLAESGDSKEQVTSLI